MYGIRECLQAFVDQMEADARVRGAIPERYQSMVIDAKRALEQEPVCWIGSHSIRPLQQMPHTGRQVVASSQEDKYDLPLYQ